jgi:hypothetical protein
LLYNTITPTPHPNLINALSAARSVQSPKKDGRLLLVITGRKLMDSTGRGGINLHQVAQYNPPTRHAYESSPTNNNKKIK